MAESNLKEMILDEVIDSANDENFAFEDQSNDQVPSYMLNSYGTFVKAWDFTITILLIYDFLAVPFFLTYPDMY